MTPEDPELQALDEEHGPQDPPPFLRKWSNLYAIVIGELIVLILLFYWFTISYS